MPHSYKLKKMTQYNIVNIELLEPIELAAEDDGKDPLPAIKFVMVDEKAQDKLDELINSFFTLTAHKVNSGLHFDFPFEGQYSIGNKELMITGDIAQLLKLLNYYGALDKKDYLQLIQIEKHIQSNKLSNSKPKPQNPIASLFNFFSNRKTTENCSTEPLLSKENTPFNKYLSH